MRDKLILTDADGCILDWTSAFEKFMHSEGFPKLPGTDSEYSIALRHGIPPSSTLDIVRKFNEGPAIATLESFADSVEYIGKLKDLGFKFIVVTSVSDSQIAKHYRTKNLVELFGDDTFVEINCIAMGSSKKEILNRWRDTGLFWIEDHIQNAIDGYDLGLKSVLVSHAYNDAYTTNSFPKVSFNTPWQEIHSMVLKEYN